MQPQTRDWTISATARCSPSSDAEERQAVRVTPDQLPRAVLLAEQVGLADRHLLPPSPGIEIVALDVAVGRREGPARA